MREANKRCETCGAPIYAPPYLMKRKRFCSRKCLGTANLENCRNGRKPTCITGEPLTLEAVSALLDYNPETGKFFWKQSRGGTARIGSEAGSLGKNGYILIVVGLNKAYAHRLAYLFIFGEWPTEQVDHINGIRHDNRAVNLRAATNQQNQANRRSTSANGLKGVTYDRRKSKWIAQITVNQVHKFLGLFNTREEAGAAYLAAARGAFGEYASDGVRDGQGATYA